MRDLPELFMITYQNSRNTGMSAETEISIDSTGRDASKEFQVTIVPSNGATGTVTPTVKARGGSSFESITDNGVAISVNLASPLTFRIFGMIEAIKLTPATLVGTFSAVITGTGD